MTKKGSTQRSSIWEKIADTLNKCSVPKFFVDKRSVRDHVGIVVNRHKKKLRDEEKASGITPDEPSELDLALDTIIALEKVQMRKFTTRIQQRKTKLKVTGQKRKA